MRLNRCRPGGRLTLTGYGKDNATVFEVNDTGCGIPQGIDIFKMFTTTKPDGSGLGLYIVRQIVEAHQGTVEYPSDAIQGTTFMVTLPIERTLSS
jgi:signal transduction histidine kinase